MNGEVNGMANSAKMPAFISTNRGGLGENSGPYLTPEPIRTR